MIPHWSGRYVGIPFADGGREREQGVDCWGLVRLVFKHEKQIELPTYGDISAADIRAIALKIHEVRDQWILVTSRPREFDVVMMSGRRDPERPGRADIHVGLVVACGDLRVLHADYNAHSVCVPLTDQSVRFRIQSYLRHRELA